MYDKDAAAELPFLEVACVHALVVEPKGRLFSWIHRGLWPIVAIMMFMRMFTEQSEFCDCVCACVCVCVCPLLH